VGAKKLRFSILKFFKKFSPLNAIMRKNLYFGIMKIYGIGSSSFHLMKWILSILNESSEFEVCVTVYIKSMLACFSQFKIM
jgi:hypothetical protein